MFCNDMEKLSNFACNLGILHKKILLMPYKNDVKMYKIMTYHFTQFMIGFREDFEPTRASLLSRSHLPSLDVAVKELISEKNQRLHHHLSSSNVVGYTSSSSFFF